jgi:uncharacterized protein YabN with tetrapyrrole methylase and pyrophosphatase domain
VTRPATGGGTRLAGSLTIVGTGIRLASQVTSEALAQIEHAERLFYLAGEPATAYWLQRLNASAESLLDCYVEGRPRAAAYVEMATRALDAVRAGQRVVVAFYGHPGIAVDPAHAMLRQARKEGYRARMLPGISAEACLIADLGVDPLRPGWQSYEAWTFMAARPRFDPRVSLVLWQIGLIYHRGISMAGTHDPRGLKDLSRALSTRYPSTHSVVLYEASPFHIAEPRIERCPLARLPRVTVDTSTTLYVPPLSRRRKR